MTVSVGLVVVLLAIVAVGSMLAARRLNLPPAIALVLAGAAAGFLPNLPPITPNPRVIFLGFLPPLVYHAAFFSSPRRLLRNRVPIAFLAVGLLGATIIVIAATAHAVTPLTWPQAFALGAVVSPTDPVAATTIMRRLGTRVGLRTILEGESLFNDAFALVALSTAVGAATGSTAGAGEVVVRLLWAIAAAIAIGCAVGWIVERTRRAIDDADTELIISLITPYAAYLCAHEVGASGVLAAVSAGLWLGWRTAGLFLPRTRLQATTFWNMLAFLLNSALFLLIGLQLRTVARQIDNAHPLRILGWCLLILAAAITVRLCGSLATMLTPRWLRLHLPQDALHGRGWRDRVVIGWSGFRGAVSIAAALSVPIAVGTTSQRSLLIVLTFAVVFGTLTIHGVTLPFVIRALGMSSEGSGVRAELEARLAATEAAIDHLEEQREARDEETRPVVDMLAERFDRRRARLTAALDDEDDQQAANSRAGELRSIRAELLNTQRQAVVRCRNAGRISSETMRRVIRELDLQDLSLNEGGDPSDFEPIDG